MSAQIVGTGKGGRITKEDVVNYNPARQRLLQAVAAPAAVSRRSVGNG